MPSTFFAVLPLLSSQAISPLLLLLFSPLLALLKRYSLVLVLVLVQIRIVIWIECHQLTLNGMLYRVCVSQDLLSRYTELEHNVHEAQAQQQNVQTTVHQIEQQGRDTRVRNNYD